MRILLISGNRERVPYPVLPIGLAWIAAALEADGHDVTLLDLCFASHPLRAAARAIRRHRPRWIGIGMRNLDNCESRATKSFLSETRALVEACRAASPAPVVLGGSGASVLPEAIGGEVGADLVVAGNGEDAARAIARAYADRRSPEGIPGVLRIGGGGTGTRKGGVEARGDPGRTPRVPGPAGSFPAGGVRPRIHRRIDLRPYLRTEMLYPIQTKRGCALRCLYCTYPNVEGSRYRFRPAAEVAGEIEEVVRETPVRDFEFVDSTFNAPPRHAMAICRALEEARLPARFVGGGMNPLATTPELLDAMRRAGFRALVSTAESASDRVLEGLRKDFDRDALVAVARATRASELAALWIFLLGGPGEDRATVEETLAFVRDELGPRDVAYVTVGLRIYPDTPLAARAREEGLVARREDLLLPRFYVSPRVEEAWIRGRVAQASRGDPRILTQTRSQSRWIPLGLRVLGAIGARRPYWRFVPAMNRALRWVS